MGKKESELQKQTLKYLNGIKGCIAENVHGSIYTSGRPDVNACYNGILLRIELKIPDHYNKPSTAQEIDLRKWARAGAVCVAVYSLDEVKYLVNPKYGIACLKKGMCEACPIRKEYCFSQYRGVQNG